MIVKLPKIIIDSHCHGRDLLQHNKTTVQKVLEEAKNALISITVFMPNTIRPITSLSMLRRYSDIINLAKMNLEIISQQYIYFGVTDTNLGHCEQALECNMVVGLKIYPLAKSGESVTTGTIGVARNNTIRRAMLLARDAGKVVAVHCDDPKIISQEGNSINAEASYVKKIIRTAESVPGVKVVICHISSIKSAQIVIEAQKKGTQVAMEFTPHHLWFDSDGTNTRKDIDPVFYHCFNVIRSQKDRRYLQLLLTTDNPLIFIGSDSACHLRVEKLANKGLGGIPSNQELVPVILTLAKKLRLSDERVCQLISWNAADFLGISTSKGTVRYKLEEKMVTCSYNDGKVENPWKGIRLLFPEKKIITPYKD